MGVTIAAAFTLPHFENVYLASYTHSVSIASAQAVLSSIAQGMMALTGIIFSLAFVMVRFSATAYSPRLVVRLARDQVLFHLEEPKTISLKIKDSKTISPPNCLPLQGYGAVEISPAFMVAEINASTYG